MQAQARNFKCLQWVPSGGSNAVMFVRLEVMAMSRGSGLSGASAAAYADMASTVPQAFTSSEQQQRCFDRRQLQHSNGGEREFVMCLWIVYNFVVNSVWPPLSMTFLVKDIGTVIR